jgi:hypothetical protein
MTRAGLPRAEPDDMSCKKSLVLGSAALAAVMLAAVPSAHALGVGAGLGFVEPTQGAAGSSAGLFGRLGLIGPLDLQLDYAKTSYGGAVERNDARYGAGLRLALKLGSWVPAAHAGMGVLDVEAADWDGQLFYTQMGLGLGFAFNDFVRLELDLARGHEDVISGARAEMPETVAQNGDGTAYTTGTLGLAVEF